MVKFDPRKAQQSLVFEYQFQRFAGLVADMDRIRQGTSVEDLAGDAPLLNHWAFAERPVACLMGYSTGHPVLEGTGRLIATSDLRLIADDGTWARTLSRWYRLGDPHSPAGPDHGGQQSWQ